MQGLYDIHCHIIPGVDDGAADMETALAILKKEYEDGVRHIILTPHYRREMFEPSMKEVLAGFEALKRAAEPDLSLYFGCEFHVNTEMSQTLDAKLRPTMAGSCFVLSEFSEISPESFFKERCYHLVGSGYIPILAHVERYRALTHNFDLIEELTDIGCRIQVNADAVLGKNGVAAKRFCRKLIMEDMLDFIGSDAHDLKRRAPHLGECAEYLEKKAGRIYTSKIFRENPAEILEAYRML